MFEKIRNVITSLPIDRLRPNLGGHIPSCPRHVPHDLVAMATGNGAMNILQLWASGGQTRDPILMKFGIQQQIRNTMTVTSSNIKIFKIQNGGQFENIRIVITSLPVDRLRTNLGGHIPSCPRHVPHDLVAMATGNGAMNILQLWASGGRTR